MDHFLDLPYVSSSQPRDRFCEFDIFVPHRSRGDQPLPPLICFVHGGAWRSEDKGDHRALARNLAAHTGCAVAVPNYRLTTPANRLRHPAHAEDLLRFLTYAVGWAGPEGQLYDPRQVYLVGHSCSAHMIASILLHSPLPSLQPPRAVLQAVRGVAVSEGIYDIDALLDLFPRYREWFIANTFGDLPSYEEVNTLKYPVREGGSHVAWLVVHSTGDRLVDARQSRAFYDYLCTSRGEEDTAGKVLNNWEELDQDHNELLKTDTYIRIVGDFVRSISAVSSS